MGSWNPSKFHLDQSFVVDLEGDEDGVDGVDGVGVCLGLEQVLTCFLNIPPNPMVI